MKRQIVAGNWKMNLSSDEAQLLAAAVTKAVSSSGPEVILAPPFIYLEKVLSVVRSNPAISVGAQNCHEESKGAFTGEVSAAMLKTIGITHVILGHSERRKHFNESHSILKQKIDAVTNQSMIPIFCCGETSAERTASKHFETVHAQLNNSLLHLPVEKASKVIIAYEPVWAIGTGVNATPQQAGEMHGYIRQLLAKRYGEKVAAAIPLLYGGSCNPSNAGELFALPDVNGGLIGGASLKAAEFAAILGSF